MKPVTPLNGEKDLFKSGYFYGYRAGFIRGLMWGAGAVFLVAAAFRIVLTVTHHG